MKTEEIINLSDLNLAEFTREQARWDARSEIIEADDLLLTKGPGRNPITSVAVNLSYTKEAPGVFERIRSFYECRQSGFSIRLRRHADEALESICRQEKMIQVGDAAGMIADRPFPGRITAGVEVRLAADVAGAVDLASVSAQSYQDLGMPVHVTEKIFAFPARVVRPYNLIVVAYEEGKPLSAAMITLSHGIGGLYWVGTVKEARGRGLAEACVASVSNEAFQRGARLIVLQASAFGEPVYRRMGFREITRYPWYLKFADKSA